MELTWMEKLKQHLNYCLNWCERTKGEICMHQAFGAVQFAVFEHPEAEREISLNYGMTLSLVLSERFGA